MTDKEPDARRVVLSMLIEARCGENPSFDYAVYAKNNLVSFSDSDRGFIKRLFEGTVERRIEEDYIIGLFSKVAIGKIKPFIRNILRMSVYQLKYMDTPDYSVCNEAVKIVKKSKFKNLSPFTNALLRNIANNIDSIEYPKDRTDNLSVRYSVPKWIIESLDKDYGIEVTERILDSLYEEPLTHLRILKNADKDEITGEIGCDNIVRADGIPKEAVIVKAVGDISKLGCFESGKVTVQNISSMLVSHVSGANDTDTVVDVCAAPGGKSLHISESVQGGVVYSFDQSEDKINLINENIKRLGISNIKTEVCDGTVGNPKLFGKADVVIADVPCSGLGVIRNKTDIKYNISKESVNELSKLQREILRKSAEYLKDGGTFVFSTCTMNSIENDNNADFLENELSLTPCDFEDDIKDVIGCADYTYSRGRLQIFTGRYGIDGFFIAKYKKLKVEE